MGGPSRGPVKRVAGQGVDPTRKVGYREDTIMDGSRRGGNGFTHLGNGCPMTMHRHDNVVQRVLSQSDRLWISFIADGAHIPFPALGNYLRCVGLERSVIVTDAISAAGLGPGTYTIGSQKVTIGEDLVPWADDRTHFVGSATVMPRVEQNLREVIGLSPADVRRLTYENPRQLLGI